VIFVALVLVLVGIIWTVVNNVVGENVDKTKFNQKCLDVQIKPLKANCDADGICNVTVERSGTGDDINGLKINFIDETGDDSFLNTTKGNIERLERKTFRGIDTGLDSIKNIEVTAYFKSDKGDEVICSQKDSIVPTSA
ncbi:MAG: hypothetical protein ACOC3Z_00535, partial [Nanoarchaeota archaeon]